MAQEGIEADLGRTGVCRGIGVFETIDLRRQAEFTRRESRARATGRWRPQPLHRGRGPHARQEQRVAPNPASPSTARPPADAGGFARLSGRNRPGVKPSTSSEPSTNGVSPSRRELLAQRWDIKLAFGRRRRASTLVRTVTDLAVRREDRLERSARRAEHAHVEPAFARANAARQLA